MTLRVATARRSYRLRGLAEYASPAIMTSHELRFPLGSAFPPVWFSHEMCVPGVYVEQELCLTTSYAFPIVMHPHELCFPW